MKKNNRLLLIVGVLLLFGGIAFAYFVGKMLSAGQGASVKVTTANIKNSELNIEGELALDAPDMLPGHQAISILKVTAKGNNELIPFNIIWEGTNELGTPLNFTVYKTSDENLKETVKAKCDQKKEKTGGRTMLYETCDISNIDKLGEVIGTGEITTNAEKAATTIAPDQFMTSLPEPGSVMYYYVILEYPNLPNNQNTDMGLGFNGEVKVEPSETEPDIQIASVQVEQEDGTYKEQEEIPEGYTIDTKQSKCTNEVTPKWDMANKGLLVNNLTKSGTTCNLYFYKVTPEKTLVKLGYSKSQGAITTLTGPSCESTSDNCGGDGTNMKENGVYDAEDDYGISYIFRGTIDNNWLKFGKDADKDIWWRIIRINGNGTIRLIYAGVGEAPNNNGKNLLIGNKKYNENDNDNTYVGYMYGETEQSTHEATHKNITNSTIKAELDNWWITTDLEKPIYAEKIDVETGFCNDRSVAVTKHGNFETKGWGKEATAYASLDRVMIAETWGYASVQNPDLKCGGGNSIARQRDLFTGPNATEDGIEGKVKGNNALTYPVGLITLDEILYAGGFGNQKNNKFWLWTNQNYWTMTPSYFNGSVIMSSIDSSGVLSYVAAINTTYGIRPVINIKADVSITGKGTTDDPYVIEGAE